MDVTSRSGICKALDLGFLWRTFTDTTAPATPDTPEERHYRVQAVVDNVRAGALSPTITVVTMC